MIYSSMPGSSTVVLINAFFATLATGCATPGPEPEKVAAHLAGTSIAFRNMAYARAACPPGSYAHQFVRALDAATTCGVVASQFVIGMEMKSGVMRFVPARVVK